MLKGGDSEEAIPTLSQELPRVRCMGKRVTFDPSGAKLAKKTKYEYSLCGGPRSPAALFFVGGLSVRLSEDGDPRLKREA